MRTIDCIPYNGESIVLFRLAYLWDVIDEFIVVEAAETHVGRAKDFLYLERDAGLFEPFRSKMTRLIIDRFPEPSAAQLETLGKRGFITDPGVWHREVFQRNFAAQRLREIASPWILFCCDADEIPRREAVSALREHYAALDDPHRLEMHLFYYSSDWIKRSKWYHAFVVNDRGFQRESLDDMRVGAHVKKFVHDAGWHLSYFMTEEEIQRKVSSMAHTEFNTAENRALEWIRHCQQTGVDLYHRGGVEDCTRYGGEDLPAGLRDFELRHGIRR